MAGPCLTILLPKEISEIDKVEIFDYLSVVSNHIDGDDFWVSGQPFIISFYPADEEESTYDIDGWNPQSTIAICAMCNNQSSHVLLATLGIKIATLLNGFIYLERIVNLTDSTAVLNLSGHIKLNELDYAVTPAFMMHWISEPNFRILK